MSHSTPRVRELKVVVLTCMVVLSVRYGHAEELDVNGDGFPDLVINADPQEPGYVFCYHGGSSGLVTAVATEIQGPDGPHWPFTGANVGDLNQDGYMDVAFGAYHAGGNSGQAYLYLGHQHHLQ